jgi:hypothetical protein
MRWRDGMRWIGAISEDLGGWREGSEGRERYGWDEHVAQHSLLASTQRAALHEKNRAMIE